jgi:hypothetical protein
MEVNIIDQWYMTPLWIVNTIGFGKMGYEKLKEMKDSNIKLLPALIYLAGAAFSAYSTGICLENLLKRF